MAPALGRIVAVGIGGFVGAVGRYGLAGLVQRWVRGDFPWGTLAVNVLGCFLIGLLMALARFGIVLCPRTRTFLGIGLLGSLTTFSTFGYETMELVRTGSWFAAAGNVAGNVILGLAAVLAGLAAGRLLAGI